MTTAAATKRSAYALNECKGLRRDQAAAYVGVSATLFDQMVADGRMPQPKMINSCVVWDRAALDVAFDALPNRGDDTLANVWDAHEENETSQRHGAR